MKTKSKRKSFNGSKININYSADNINRRQHLFSDDDDNGRKSQRSPIIVGMKEIKMLANKKLKKANYAAVMIGGEKELENIAKTKKKFKKGFSFMLINEEEINEEKTKTNKENNKSERKSNNIFRRIFRLKSKK